MRSAWLQQVSVSGDDCLPWYIAHSSVIIEGITFLSFHLFIYRESGREGERERNINVCFHTGDLACNPGKCPDWESNQQPFDSQACAQSTEPQQPGWYHLNLRTPKPRLCEVGVFIFVQSPATSRCPINSASGLSLLFLPQKAWMGIKGDYSFFTLPVCCPVPWKWYSLVGSLPSSNQKSRKRDWSSCFNKVAMLSGEKLVKENREAESEALWPSVRKAGPFEDILLTVLLKGNGQKPAASCSKKKSLQSCCRSTSGNTHTTVPPLWGDSLG